LNEGNKLKVIGGKILIKKSAASARTTESGIILQSKENDKVVIAEVINVNPVYIADNGKSVTQPVKIGDIVAVLPNAGVDVSIDENSKNLAVITVNDIVVILDE
jgi:co-chaperonin GroES (HSP10)